MTQVPHYQVPAHPSGLDMRTQLNAIVLALLGDNAGPTQPAEMYPGMMWGDTTANRLKRRTNANDAWIDIGPLDDFLGDMRSGMGAINNKVSKTGDTMTGALTISTGANSSVCAFNANAGIWKQLFFESAGKMHWTISQQGTAESGSNVGGDFAIDRYDDGGNWLSMVLNIIRQTGQVRINSGLVSSSADGNQIRVIGTGGKYGVILRNDDTTFYALITNAWDPWGTWTNARPLSFNLADGALSTGGTLWVGGELHGTSFYGSGNLYLGNAIYQNDGNVYLPWASGWLSNVMAFRTRGANTNNVQTELGRLFHNGAHTVDAGSPWVMCGVRCDAWLGPSGDCVGELYMRLTQVIQT